MKGSYDVFISRFTPNLSDLIASTFVGGGGWDQANALAIDRWGNVYITGKGQSGYPTTPGAYDQTFRGYSDVIVSKLDPYLTNLQASTFIGRNYTEEAYDIILDNYGNVYIAGYTQSSSFPTTPGAYDQSHNGGTYDAFIAD